MEEIDLKELFDFLKSKIVWILVTIIIAIVIGNTYTLLTRVPMYKTNVSLVLVSEKSGEGNTAYNSSEQQLNKNLVGTYSEIVKSKVVLNKVISNLGLGISYNELKNNIEVSSVENTEIINIYVSNKDSKMATLIANEIATVFVGEINKFYKLNNVNINGKSYSTFSIIYYEDSSFKLTNMVKIININVSHYRDLCYTKGVNELTDFEIAVGVIGIYEEDMLEKISKRNQVLKGISDIVKKYSWEDDVIVAYDREEYLKEAFEANIEYAVADAVEETTKRVTEEVTEKNKIDMARKLKQENADIDLIVKVTGLSKEEINKL